MFVIIDLFAGIGGFSLAAQREGIETLLFCEIDKYCQKVLAKNFPGTLIHPDIKTLTMEIIFKEVEKRYGKHNGAIEFILTGGFPCQPFSHAGKRKGDKDERALFPEMLRVVREAKPKWIVAENVGGILSIHDGEYFEEICTQLEDQGYTVQPFIIPASAVNAPHKRDRVWIIAHYVKDTEQLRDGRRDNGDTRRSECALQIERPDSDAKNTEYIRCSSQEREEETQERGFGEFSARNDARISDKNVADMQSGKTGREAWERVQRESPASNGQIDYATNSESGEDDGRERRSMDEKEERWESFNSAVKSCNKHFSHTTGERLEECEAEGFIKPILDVERTDTPIANATSARCESELCEPGERETGNSWERSWYEVAQRFCQLDDGVSVGLVGCLTLVETHSILGFILLIRSYFYGTSEKTRTDKILSILRESFNKKDYKRTFGGFGEFYSPEELQCPLHGEGDGKSFSKEISTTKESGEIKGEKLSIVRNKGELTYSPYRQGHSEQCTCEFDDIVRELSSKVALGEWADNTEASENILFDLWQESRGERFLHEPLSALYEIWRSLTDKEIGTFRRHYNFRDKDRVQKLKSLGNAIVPKIAQLIYKAIKSIEEKINVNI